MKNFFAMAEQLGKSLPEAKWKHRFESGFEPVHVVYGGADRFKADISTKFGNIALGVLRLVAIDDDEFREIFNDGDGLSVPEGVFDAVTAKLARQPVEDYRIDFEDGFGFRSDTEEDSCCRLVAEEIARGMREESLPPIIGIRVKSFQRETFSRATRTLGLCLQSLLSETGNRLPDRFTVTLPKIRHTGEVEALDRLLSLVECEAGLPVNRIEIELMAETPESVLDIESLVRMAPGRISSVHFGAYDFTSELGITGSYQDINHPASDFAKHLIQLKLAGSGIRLSDSVTPIMPIAPHKATDIGELEKLENRKVIQNALKVHYKSVALSMEKGYFQSWDLHPGQLIARYAAVLAFFRNEAEEQGERLRAFLRKATQATLTGNVFDDAATVQGYLNFFRKAFRCGALNGDQIEELTGLETNDLLHLSFSKLPKMGEMDE
jgi:hypothetical protein